MESEPTNAVLAAKLDGLASIVNTNQQQNREDHVALIAQTTKTNGRVTKLEKMMNMALGALAVVSMLILPMARDLISKWLSSH